jgi:hypothetical protein
MIEKTELGPSVGNTKENELLKIQKIVGNIEV